MKVVAGSFRRLPAGIRFWKPESRLLPLNLIQKFATIPNDLVRMSYCDPYTRKRFYLTLLTSVVRVKLLIGWSLKPCLIIIEFHSLCLFHAIVLCSLKGRLQER